MKAPNVIRWLVLVIGVLLALVFWKIYPQYAIGWAAFFIGGALFIGERIAKLE